MAKWQNLERAFFDSIDTDGHYDMPIILPTYELPKYNRMIEFDYCNRIRDKRDNIGVHFFEDDYKFERCWTYPDRYGEMLKDFAFVIGPDFSTYADFPLPVVLYNHYRNRWLCRYWQEKFDIPIIPTVLWGYEDTFDFCFDGLPQNSVVAVSNVGIARANDDKTFFMNGYNEMLKRLNPSKVLFHTRNFQVLPGNVEYIQWQIHKGDQVDGWR